MILNEKQIEEIEARANRATPGPWEWEGAGVPDEDGYFHIPECASLEPTAIQHVNDQDGYWHDAKFIEQARADIPNLLETVKALRKENEQQRELLKKALPHVKHDLESWDAELIDQIENT